MAFDPAMPADVEVDARGLRCPRPVIDVANACADSPPGTIVRLLADDPTAEVDVPVWARMRRQRLLGRGPWAGDGGGTAYLVEVV